MSRPSTIADYIDWAKGKLGADFGDFQNHSLYRFNVQEAYGTVTNHRFYVELPAHLAKWAEEYKTQTGSDLFMERTRLDLSEKTYDSAVNKSFRANVLLNESFPDPPRKGWALPENLAEYINDSIRGSLVCRFLDGPSYVTSKLAEYADGLGIEHRQYSQERDEGYYAYHFYAEFDVTLYDSSGAARTGQIDMEIQVTTQLQDVLRSLTHVFYEERRLLREKDTAKWKWEFTSSRFRVGYLSHTLHLLEAIIVQSRDDVHEQSTAT